VLRGIEGFGASSRIHTSRILALSEDLPLVIEVVDTAERVEAFLAAVDELLTEGAGHDGAGRGPRLPRPPNRSVSWLLVAVGGSLGAAAARYLLDRAIATRQTSPFPLGTLVVNVTGSIALGLLLGLAASHQIPSSIVILVGTGFLGAYTTFSTFTFENVRLLEDGAWRYAAWNLALSGPLSFAGALVAFLAVR
jgi:CrcB protein